MGLYIRLAPCVRVRISKRGIRWAIGPACRPTASRCGRPGGSTGAGPVSVYWGLRRRRQRQSAPPLQLAGRHGGVRPAGIILT